MARKVRKSILFPLGGLNKKLSYKQQPPYTTPDCQNVLPFGPFERRTRGGSRPGLIKAYALDLGTEVWAMDTLTYVPSVSNGVPTTGVPYSFTSWLHTVGFPSDWVKPTSADTGPHTASVDSDGYYYLSGVAADLDKGSFLTVTESDFDNYAKIEVYVRTGAIVDTKECTIDLGITNTDDTGNVRWVNLRLTIQYLNTVGKYKFYIDGGPGINNNAWTIDLGSNDEGWLTLVVDNGVCTGYWNGTQEVQITLPAGAWRTGAGYKIRTGVQSGSANEIRIGGTLESGGGALRVYGTFSGYDAPDLDLAAPSGLATSLVAISGGTLYRESVPGTLTALTSNLSLRDSRPLQTAQLGQKLYIADYGDKRVAGTDGVITGATLDAASVSDWSALSISIYDHVAVLFNVGGATVAGVYAISSIAAGALTLASSPGDGTCSYIIERAPKVFDPVADTLSNVVATDGILPVGNPHIVSYLDRMVLAGASTAPHVWYMSRRGDELDWDYAASDSERAVAGTTGVGTPGEAITALVSIKDDYLVIGCRDSLWLMRGDPAYGGTLDVISTDVGIVSPNAWTIGPSGELIFLSLQGLYVLPSVSENTKAVPISRDVLPQEFLNLNTEEVNASLKYDVDYHGIHIFFTKRSSDASTHWWLDWASKTYWPMVYNVNHEATSLHVLQSNSTDVRGLLLGCRDGYIRRFYEKAADDDGTSFSSYVRMGPINLSSDGRSGKLRQMQAVLAENSGGVTWALSAADTPEGAVTASSSDSGSWVAGLNATDWPACVGQAYTLLVTGATDVRWALEQIIVTYEDAGPLRII